MRWGPSVGVAVAVAVLTVAACGSSGSKDAGSTGTSTTRVSSGGIGSPTGSGSTGSGASSNGELPVKVGITVSGASNATIKGTKGRCEISKQTGNNYDFEGADYPSLGAHGVFDLTSEQRLGTQIEGPTIKLVVGDKGYITSADTGGIKFSPDRTLVQLNQSITSSTNGGPPQTVHIVGSIECGDRG